MSAPTVRYVYDVRYDDATASWYALELGWGHIVDAVMLDGDAGSHDADERAALAYNAINKPERYKHSVAASLASLALCDRIGQCRR